MVLLLLVMFEHNRNNRESPSGIARGNHRLRLRIGGQAVMGRASHERTARLNGLPWRF
jgi:hypothetical protein